MTSTALSDDLELLLHLDRSAEHSLQYQLIEQLEHAILQGQFAPGRRLPSTRALSGIMGISRNVVVAAYDELFARGAIVRKPGSGTAVNNDLHPQSLPDRLASAAHPRWLRSHPPLNEDPLCPPQHAIVFQPGASDFTAFPLSAWRSMWKGVSNHLPPTHDVPRAGDVELRVAITEYLKRSRGVTCILAHEGGTNTGCHRLREKRGKDAPFELVRGISAPVFPQWISAHMCTLLMSQYVTCGPDDVMITAGATQAVNLIARALLLPGESVGFEEPGYLLARRMLLAHGASLVPIPVDEDGLRVDMLPTGIAAPLLVYVTPSHQFPLGGRLPTARRLALLEWAQVHDSVIIEDDYDSEFRFGATPLPTLTSLDRRGRVVYLGTFSKILSPMLRLGYVVAPAPLRQHLEHLVRFPTEEATWPIQRVVLACLREGHLERHIRRMRRLYGEKCRLLGELLAPISRLARLRGLEAGLHTWLELQSGLDAKWIVQEASNRGVIVSTLDPFYQGACCQQGLLLGYGGLTRSEITQGTTTLIDVIRSAATT